eukprot:CAMPEP_0168307870 /NCGR_PEP_ID=MMETSP0142_2-20121227/59788_1 /TAXON_ID=44445 /ORGANISM="Pseudo-nitzschia australis, Strain 10249 10 AB" /LENGTH=905 /DNA_ID=CAMNT_0008260107 /DNA_START=109 /DNA_END=2823 /DNA_ORIENTATION=-
MSLLTKKFTRGSLKRASGGGTSLTNESGDPSKAELNQLEMSRARNKSMQNQNVLNKQRRHRSLSRDPSSRYHSVTGAVRKAPNFSHPNDDCSQAYNEAELLTQMSSLTEPTWAPSDLGRSDINSTHHRQNQPIQRSRTGNYNNGRRQSRSQYYNPRGHQHRATITISTGKDRKERKVLLLDSRNENEENNGPKHNESSHGARDHSDGNYGYHERASVRTEGIEVHRIERDESREDREDTTTNVDHLPTLQTRDSDLRDDIPHNNDSLSTPRIGPISSRARSRTRREGDGNSVSRTRGRSGRSSSDCKSLNRSSSLSSRRSTQSARTGLTAPTISKVSTMTTSSSASIFSRKSTTENPRTTSETTISSTKNRSSSVPKTMSDSKRKQRTLSVPPLAQKSKEMQRSGNDAIKNSGQNDKIVSAKQTSSEFNNEFFDSILDTCSTMEDATTFSSQSQLRSHAISSRSPGVSPLDSPPTPSSAIEAARISLRPRLRRSSSNRSVSSAQSESMLSSASSRQRETSFGRIIQEPLRPPSVTPTSPTLTRYASRTHKLAQDAHAKRIHKQKQQKRQEEERVEKQRQKKVEEKLRRKEARAASLAILSDGEEPQHTTINTLLYDFLIFHLLLLLSFPRYLLSFLWSQTFSKKWSARRKTVLVTGASSPLASETARQFAAAGANIILVSHSAISSADDLDWLVEECQELGCSKVQSYSADLSNSVSAELTLRQAAKDFNDTFDVVILNGENKSHGCLFEEIVDVHQIDKMVKENTTGCMMTLHFALKHIPKTSDSRIVILSSTSGLVASPYKSVYGATQHALKGFCDSIRMELNNNYTERRAPKICYASFPDLVGQYIHHPDADSHMLRMGAGNPPMKTRSWAAIPLQQAVHDLLEAVSSGQRDFGSPRHVQAW